MTGQKKGLAQDQIYQILFCEDTGNFEEPVVVPVVVNKTANVVDYSRFGCVTEVKMKIHTEEHIHIEEKDRKKKTWLKTPKN